MSRAVFTQKSPWQVFILNGLALLGVGAAIALTQHYFDVRNGTAGFKSFCNIGQAMNCDAIAASPQAELIPGFPLSSFVAGWYLAFFLVSLFAHNVFWRRETVRALFGMSLVGTGIGLFYLAIMAFQLRTYCLLCLGVDVINLISFFLALSLKPEGFSEHKPDLKKWKVFAPMVVISLIIGVVGLKSLDQLSLQSSDLKELTDSVLTTAPVSVNTSDEFPSMGPKDAPITLVEFSDFQCPFCRIGAFTVNSILNRFPGKVRVIFRNYPLDQACNPMVPRSAHPVACEAARVGYCAHMLHKFEPVYESLFDKQATFAPGRPLEIAKEAGLDPNALESCANSQDSLMAITRDINEAKTLGVQSTPTFFINGHKMEGAYPAPVWVNIIETLLKK